jgi:hypothetical protein
MLRLQDECLSGEGEARNVGASDRVLYSAVQHRATTAGTEERKGLPERGSFTSYLVRVRTSAPGQTGHLVRSENRPDLAGDLGRLAA